MTKFRALLIGGACLGLLMLQASSDSDGRNIADTIKARIAKLQAFGTGPTPIRLAQAENQTNDSAKSEAADAKPAAASVGVTSYYGGGAADTGTPAWAAEATVFEAVTAAPAEAAPAAATTQTEAAPSAPAQEVEVANPAPAAAAEAAPAAPAASAVGVTSYYGDSAPADGQAFSAPATVFETVADAPAASTAAPADAPQAAAPEAAPQEAAKTEAARGVTSYYGDTASAEGQPFSAPATVFIAVDEAKPAEAAPAPAAAKAAEGPKVNYVESNPGPAVPGVTSFYGGSTQRAEDQPYAAAAKMMIETPAKGAPTSVAANSCRDQLTAIVQAGRILFGNNSWDIRSESYKTLDKLASAAKSCGGVVIEVGGHTDNTGTVAANAEISRLRAEAVSKYLAKAGVDAAKLKAAGFGQSNPVADNSTPEGRQKNRRIEFVVSGG